MYINLQMQLLQEWERVLFPRTLLWANTKIKFQVGQVPLFLFSFLEKLKKLFDKLVVTLEIHVILLKLCTMCVRRNTKSIKNFAKQSWTLTLSSIKEVFSNKNSLLDTFVPPDLQTRGFKLNYRTIYVYYVMIMFIKLISHYTTQRKYSPSKHNITTDSFKTQQLRKQLMKTNKFIGFNLCLDLFLKGLA